MKSEFKLSMQRDGRLVLTDTIKIEDFSVMSAPNADEFEKQIRDYIRSLNP